MFRCGIAYPRCKWIVPLLLLFAIIFDIIAVAASSGWIEEENSNSHYSSMWEECRTMNKDVHCRPLTEFGWGKAVAALMIIGLLILILAFILSIVSLCNVYAEYFIPIGLLLGLVVILQIIALILYPVKFNELIFEGNYNYTWAYGFGWGATILAFGCSILFCCLPKYEDDLTENAKIKYLYESG